MYDIPTYTSMYDRMELPFSYHDYSPEDKIYHLSDGGVGIMFRCYPQHGGREVEAGLTTLYSILPENAHIQIILFASPNVTKLTDDWKRSKRVRDGLYGEIINDMTSYFDGTGAVTQSSHNFTIYITIKLDGGGEVHDTLTFKNASDKYRKRYVQLKDLYNRIDGALKEAMLYPATGNPDELINFVYTCLNQKHDFRDIPLWDGSSIKDFCVADDTLIDINDKYIVADGVYGKSLSVKEYPKQWALSLSDMFSGRVHGGVSVETPFIVCLNLTKLPKEKIKSTKLKAQIVLNQKLPHSLFPRLAFIQEDIGMANVRLEQGELLYHINLSLFVFAENLDKLDSVAAQFTSYYQSHMFRLHEDVMINGISLLSVLPFGWDDETKKLLDRGRTVFVDSAIALAPVSADNSGSNPQILFVTPRRQLYSFDLFANEAGGFCAFVIGTTGAGKSVAMQYIGINYLLSGARLFILDIGESYKRFCNAFGGEYIEIDPMDPICMNPFSTIKDDTMFHEFQDFLADLFYMMGSTLERQLSQQQEKLIKSHLMEALLSTWKKYHSSSCVDTVIEELKIMNVDKGDSRLEDFITTITPYSSLGKYGAFFNGESTINFHSNLVVLENRKMENIPDLRDPIIMILTYHISKHIYVNEKADTRYVVIVDEAHKFLGNPKIDLFVEQAYRRFRKSGASMILGTQGFNDLYDENGNNRAGRVIIENSQYKIFMLQTSVSRQKMKKSDLFDLSSYYEEMLDSIMPVAGQYSEMMIITEVVKGVKVRLYLPKLLQTMFFSGKDTRLYIEKLVKEGMSYEEAIKQVTYGENRNVT